MYIMKASECIAVINGESISCKIMWRRGSKFEIVECEDRKYVGLIIDASDILRCNTTY